MEIDYRWWQTKEEIKAFMEESDSEEQNKTNVALMSLVSFFTLSKLFQLRNRIGEAGEGYADSEDYSKFSKKGEGRDDAEVKPGSSSQENR